MPARSWERRWHRREEKPAKEGPLKEEHKVQDASRYFNDLFEQMPSEQVYEVLRNAPEEIGRFSICQKNTRQGIDLLDWRMNYQRDVHVYRRGENNRDEVQFVFCMNQGMVWEIEGIPQTCFHGKRKCLYLSEWRQDHMGILSGKMRFRV